MTMEHRLHARQHTDIGLVISGYTDKQAFQGRGRNVSSDGMAIEGSFCNLPVNRLIEVRINIDSRIFQLTGIIAHSARNSIGIMFTQPQPDINRFVTPALQEQPA